MVTAQISLTDAQNKALETVARQTGKTREEVIQDAIERLLEQDQTRRRHCMNQGFGIWKDRTDLPDFDAMRAECDRIEPVG